MKNFYKTEKLNFLTAGMPLSTGKGGYQKAFGILREMGLDGMEVEFVHGVRMTDETRKLLKSNDDLMFTAHGPFYVNLNSKEEEKIEASVQRIIETAQAASDFGGYSITYHAAFYMGADKETVYQQVKNQSQKIMNVLKENNIKMWIRPETTGKATQWGDLEEIVRLSKEFETVLPCVDFSHLHARYNGGVNEYKDFCQIFETIGNELGQTALDNFHAHIAGIEYGEKGEKKHLNLEESDMNYKDLLRAFKEFNVKGAIVCESPNIEDDAKLMKDFYLGL
jgi:deoxyribonuclease-4